MQDGDDGTEESDDDDIPDTGLAAKSEKDVSFFPCILSIFLASHYGSIVQAMLFV